MGGGGFFVIEGLMLFIYLCIYKMWSDSVTQAGVQLHSHDPLQP